MGERVGDHRLCSTKRIPPGAFGHCLPPASRFLQPRCPHCFPLLPLPVSAATHGRIVALYIRIRRLLGPLDLESFRWLEDLRYYVCTILAAQGHSALSHFKCQRGVFRGPLGGSTHVEVVNLTFIPRGLALSTWSWASLISHHREHHTRKDTRLSFCRATTPPPQKRDHRFRIVGSMRSHSHRVFLRAWVYKMVV